MDGARIPWLSITWPIHRTYDTGTWYIDRAKWSDRKTNQDRCLTVRIIARRRKRPGYKTKLSDGTWWPFNYCIDRCQVKLEDNHEPTSGMKNKPFVRFHTHHLSDYHAFRVFPSKNWSEYRECDREILQFTA